MIICVYFFFFFQAEDGIRDLTVTGVQTCALPIFAEQRRVRFARRPAVRAVLVGDVLAQGLAALGFPQRAEVETVLPQVADLLVPDRAGVEVPVRVNETRRLEGAAGQR